MKKSLCVAAFLPFFLCAMQENELIDIKQKAGCCYGLTHCLYTACTNVKPNELETLPEKTPREVIYYIFNKDEQEIETQPEQKVELWKKIIFVSGCGCFLALTLGGVALGAALA